MQSIIRHGSKVTRPLFAAPSCTFPPTQSRSISRNTAIAQGLREGLDVQRGPSRRDRRDEARRPYDPLASRSRWGEEKELFGQKPKASWDDGGLISHEELDDGSLNPLGFSVEKPSPPPVKHQANHESYEDSYKGPVSVPYTTAASEFLYGYSVIYAALKANRRKLYTLYLHKRSNSRDRDLENRGEETQGIRELAEERQVKVVEADDKWLPVMDRMADNRPHNVGYDNG
jgi:hypothetical protein